MAVPKATVDEYNDLAPEEDDVGAAGELAHVSLELETLRGKIGGDSQLWSRPSRPNLGHSLANDGWNQPPSAFSHSRHDRIRVKGLETIAGTIEVKLGFDVPLRGYFMTIVSGGVDVPGSGVSL